MYVMGPWCYGVRVEETRKELSYLSAMGAVTNEGNFNTITSQVDDGQGHCDNSDIISSSNSDSSGEHTNDDKAEAIEVSPKTKMLEKVGLFVVPVNNKLSILACVDCQKAIKPSAALSHVTLKVHKLKITKALQAEIMA